MPHQGGGGVSVNLGEFRQGGFARGQQARQQQNLQQQQLGLQERGLEQAQAGQLQKQGAELIKRADERVKTALLEAKQMRDATEAGLLTPDQEQAVTASFTALIEATKREDALIEANFGINPGNADKLRRFATGVAISTAKLAGTQAGQQSIAEQRTLGAAGLTPEELAAAGGPAIPAEQEQFTPVFDGSGNIIGQQSSKTGKVVTDPRAPSTVAGAAQFEPILNEKGEIVAQRNLQSGRVVTDPRAETAKALKPAQREAASFATRMEDSSLVFDELGEQFSEFAAVGGDLPSALQSGDRQRFEQAKRNFINATLRRESGAAIAPSEFVSAELQYIPNRGDSEAVLQQKKRNRQVVTEALKAEAGAAFGELQLRLPSLTVTIRGREFNVGDIITNDKGQSGRIEQDGSITLLD